jgi:predicted ABC-type ATPase
MKKYILYARLNGVGKSTLNQTAKYKELGYIVELHLLV